MSKGDAETRATGQREWSEGPEGWADVVAYVNATPTLVALLVELRLYEHIEHHSETCEASRDSIFTIANHWRERELSAPFGLAPRAEAASRDEVMSGCAVRATIQAEAASADAIEIARLREIEHRAWHLLESSEERTSELSIELPNEDYDKLIELLGDEHPSVVRSETPSRDATDLRALIVLATITEDQADVLGMPVSYYEKAVNFGAKLVTGRLLP